MNAPKTRIAPCLRLIDGIPDNGKESDKMEKGDESERKKEDIEWEGEWRVEGCASVKG